MLVILASRHDPLAQTLAARWQASGVGLLTCTNLSTRGWKQHLPLGADATAVVSGRVMACDEITGVLTRLPWIFEEELFELAREDRAYAAAEMSAFLLSWLSCLTCPVLNRPTPACLSGVLWRQARWLRVAADLDIPCIPLTLSSRHPSQDTPRETVTVTVVGDRCFGADERTLRKRARRLADAAGLDLLAVHFQQTEDDACFVRADLWPDPTAEGVDDAILAYLHGEYARNRAWRR